MAISPLATPADLEARGIDTSDAALVDALLASASASIRDAAGSPITETSATITVASPAGRRLDLPGPVRSVDSVTMDGQEVSDWTLVGDSLWRPRSWTVPNGTPAPVTVSLAFGLAEAPADVVDLVCNLVAAGLAHAEGGYESSAGKLSERIDDYSIQYAQGADAVVSPMELPERTRRMLARRFGGSAAMAVMRS